MWRPLYSIWSNSVIMNLSVKNSFISTMILLSQNQFVWKIFGMTKKDFKFFCKVHVDQQEILFVQVLGLLWHPDWHLFWVAIFCLELSIWNLEKCISVKMADGTCDDECNTLACNWDGDDCDGISPSQGGTDTRPSFYQSIDFVDVLFSRNIGIGWILTNLDTDFSGDTYISPTIWLICYEFNRKSHKNKSFDLN